MSDYQLAATETIIRIIDGANIPNDPANRDRAAYDVWFAAGGVPDPYVAPPAPPAQVLSQDLIAQFTVTDFTAIKTAVASSDQLALMWAQMQAQKDPMIVTNARFLAGWDALITVLGATRMTAIATALGITVS
jgi:hypothetical protein